MNAPFILASSSPRRRQILREAGYDFTVIPPPLEEPNEEGKELPPAQQAEALAFFKARSVVQAVAPNVPVLGADTLVARGQTIYGKPADADDARRILGELAGTRHAVITGLALICPDGRRMIASDTTWVTMRPIPPAEMDAYIAGGDWHGKAGAYGIQDSGDAFVQSIEGSFANVVGLPIELLASLLEQLPRTCPTRSTAYE